LFCAPIRWHVIHRWLGRRELDIYRATRPAEIMGPSARRGEHITFCGPVGHGCHQSRQREWRLWPPISSSGTTRSSVSSGHRRDLEATAQLVDQEGNGFKAPIIMLTGHNTDSDTILGLESGANDYVTKPFRFAVLLARIRAHLRDHEASEDAVFTIGPYTFRPSSKLLLNPEGNEVRLTEKETGVLRYLCRAGQRPVSRETLLQEVWGYNSGLTTHTLETHIYRLRQKIEKDAASPAILVTQADGYTLVP
jgi:DNA-binding response OmpR family regulator